MRNPASTLRTGVADMLGGALLQVFFQPVQDAGIWARPAETSAPSREPGLMAWLSAYRAERKRQRDIAEVSAMARRYEHTMPALSAELQAIIGRDIG